MVYAIYMALADHLESADPQEIYGYKVVGYVESEDEAKGICSSGGMVVDSVGVFSGYSPVYKYQRLEKFSDKVFQ